MKPSLSSVHIDAITTDMAIGYMQSLQGGIARRMLNVKRVTKPTNKYFTFSQNDFMRNDYAIRSPGTVAKRTGFTLSTDSYSCIQRALGIALPWETLDAADINLKNVAARMLASQARVSEDALFINKMFKSGVWGASTDIGTGWAAPSTGTPLKDLLDGIRAVESRIGQSRGPNSGYKVLMTRAIKDVLIQHADFVDRVKYTSQGVVTTSGMAELLQVSEVLVFDTVADAAAEGATSDPNFMTEDANAEWGGTDSNQGVLILWSDPNATPDTMLPTAGSIFSWDKYDRGAAEAALVVRSYEENDKQQSVFEGSYYVDMKIQCTAAGQFLYNALT